jgi:hypothetical protein
MGQRPRVRQVAAGAMDRVLEEIARAKRRLKLAVLSHRSAETTIN